MGRAADHPLCLVLLGACALGACHLLLPYEPGVDGAVAARDRGGDAARDAGEGGLVPLDARRPDADRDFRASIPDAGAACLADVALWVDTCRRGSHPDSCGVGCGAYTVVCIGASCTCAITDGDSHVCTGITASTASCEPASACFQAVSAGCCAWQ